MSGKNNKMPTKQFDKHSCCWFRHQKEQWFTNCSCKYYNIFLLSWQKELVKGIDQASHIKKFINVAVEGGFKIITNAVKGETRCHQFFWAIIKDSPELITNFQSCTINYIYSDSNEVAQTLVSRTTYVDSSCLDKTLSLYYH